jgi:hypothetical protein
MPRGSTDGSVLRIDKSGHVTKSVRETVRFVVKKRYTDAKGRRREKKRIAYSASEAAQRLREIEADISREKLGRVSWRKPVVTRNESRSRWSSHDVFSLEQVPSAPGCYTFYLNGILFYVGSSENLKTRLLSYRISQRRDATTGHRLIITPWGEAETVTVKVSGSARFGDWLMRERRLIARLQPPGNKRGIIAAPTRLALGWIQLTGEV